MSVKTNKKKKSKIDESRRNQKQQRTIWVEIEVKDLLIKKSFNSKKRYKSNELNPLAQKQMTKFLEEAMQKDIIDQIVIEVSTLEMWSSIN